MPRISRPTLTILSAAVIVAALFTSACQRETAAPVTDTMVTVGTTDTTTGTALNAPPSTTNADALRATAGEIIRNPGQYTGRVVTVTGDVERVYTPRAFTMDSGITPGKDLLVIGRNPVPGVAGADRAMLAGDDAIVTGRVVNFIASEIERDLGWDLDREIEIEFERQPVLIIETASATPGLPGGASGTDTAGTAGTAGTTATRQ